MAISTTALAVTSLVIGATSAVASGIAQHQQAKAQDAFNAAQAEQYKKSYEQQSRAAAQEYANQSAAERVSQMQEKEKTAIEVQEAQQEALQKKGTMMARPTPQAERSISCLMTTQGRKLRPKKSSVPSTKCLRLLPTSLWNPTEIRLRTGSIAGAIIPTSTQARTSVIPCSPRLSVSALQL